MNDVKNRRKLEIKNIQTRIDNIKNKEIKLLIQKINAQQNNLDEYRIQLNKMIVNIEDISKTNPALTALKLMEKRDISTFVAELNLQLMDMRDKKDTLETTTINDLIERKKLVESMLLPHNYKNSEVIGRVITNDYPIKPKKKLIVMVAFIAGFILSIFLVFIMNAFRKEEDKATA
jgi:capsular polysaccharide biosynthesis protein